MCGYLFLAGRRSTSRRPAVVGTEQVAGNDGRCADHPRPSSALSGHPDRPDPGAGKNRQEKRQPATRRVINHCRVRAGRPGAGVLQPVPTEPDRAAPRVRRTRRRHSDPTLQRDSPRRVRAGNPVTARPGPSHSRAPPALTCPSADRRRRRPPRAGEPRADKIFVFLSGMLSCRGSYHGGHGPHTRAAGQNKPPPPNALCPLPFCYTAREALMRCKAVFLANDKGSLDTLKTNSLYKMQAGSFETLSPLSGSWTGWV